MYITGTIDEYMLSSVDVFLFGRNKNWQVQKCNAFTVENSVLFHSTRTIKRYGLLFCHSDPWTEKETSTGDLSFRLSTYRPRRASLSRERNTSGHWMKQNSICQRYSSYRSGTMINSLQMTF